MYRTSGEAVRARPGDASSAAVLYDRYVAFVSGLRPEGDLLDVGCGNGWSSYLFSEKGYRTVGVDLNAGAFTAPPGPRLRFEQGSALALPFPDRSFDIVAGHTFLEHTPDPAQVLREMVRVTRPSGFVAIVGPNLLSLGHAARTLGRYVWQNRPVRRILTRDSGMPRHPFGNTLPEAVAATVRNFALIVRKSVSPAPDFTMREPDMVPPFHADNDACYLCNPIDIEKFLVREGFRIVHNGEPGRPPFTNLIAGGTWVAARKAAG
jgi:SAM-dependent methyltransferase